jgi:hypothetical protein
MNCENYVFILIFLILLIIIINIYDNNNNITKSNNYVSNKYLLFHYVTWCHYCKEFIPEWLKIKEYCNNNNIDCFEIDHTDNDNI